MTFICKKRTVSRSKTLELLEGLTAVPGDNAISLYLPPGIPSVEIQNILKELSVSRDVHADITKTATSSETGAVILWSPELKYMLLPPFPFPEQIVSHKIDPFPFQSVLGKDHLIALVLVRLGSYGIGVYRGEKNVTSKVGTGLVHGRHRQGGSSAHRFERHRDKQIEYFLTRVCQRAREQLKPYVKSLDYIVYGGARTTIRLLRKQCPLLDGLETPTLPHLLDVHEPRQKVLETAILRVWSTTVYEWRED